MLSDDYHVTGSDTSQVFVDLYKKSHPDADLLLLNAVTLQTERKFDCIYSNKVYQHLTQAERKSSFSRHGKVLRDGDIALHPFWYGEGEEEHHGLHFVYYTFETPEKLIPSAFNIVELARYSEMD